METFYSIVYIKPNSLTDEQLVVGVFLGGGEGPYFYLSDKRLTLLKNTVHKNTFLSLQRHLKSLKQKVDNYRKTNKELMLFDPHYSQEEFLRLHKQTKGAIKYSEPVSVNEWLNKDFYNQFILNFLGEKISKPTRNRPLFHFKWKAFYHSDKFIDWGKDVPINELNDSVDLTFKVDLVNHLEKIVVKTIDFNLSQANISKKKYELETTAQLLADYKLICVYPRPKKKSAKFIFQSTKATLKQIDFVKFTEFKLNH
jgi:hypothetical protein